MSIKNKRFESLRLIGEKQFLKAHNHLTNRLPIISAPPTLIDMRSRLENKLPCQRRKLAPSHQMWMLVLILKDNHSEKIDGETEMTKKKKNQKSGSERVSENADQILTFLHAAFSSGAKSVPFETLLPNGLKIGVAAYFVHMDILAGHGTGLSPDVQEAFETMNCLYANNLMAFEASDGLDEIAAAHCLPASSTPSL